jgi:hypothetical protein
MRTVSTRSCNRRRHRGVDFVVWREGAWFWLLFNPRAKGGMIGATTTEAQAVWEACSSIEETITVS